MRFKEAYQLIDASLSNADLRVPITPALKALTFDRFVKNAGKKMVRNVSVESLSASATNRYIITNSDYDGQIIKVEQNGTIIPFIGEKNASLDSDSDTVSQIGYWTRNQRDVISQTVTAKDDNPAAFTTASAHGLVTGDFIEMSEIVGYLSAAGALSEFNGIRHQITVYSTTQFTIAIDTSAYGVLQTGTDGLVRFSNNLLLFSKDTDGDGGDIKVYYYSAPRAKSDIDSEVDVPDLLVWSALYDTVAEFLNIDGKLQLASGYRGLAKKNRDEYMEESRNREPSFDRLVLPMQEFNER